MEDTPLHKPLRQPTKDILMIHPPLYVNRQALS